MKLSGLGEFGLIRKIKQLSIHASPSTLIGIGDDAAALRCSPSALLLATTDMLAEGVHFDLTYTDFYSLGWKSAAVNLSDIAAMGGSPRFCLTSLGIPPKVSLEQILDYYRGFNALLRIHKTDLVGGDTCSSLDGMIVSVTMLGEARRGQVITRAGARPGDRIFVTNTLGDAAAGMELLKSGFRVRGTDPKSAHRAPHAVLVERHLRPLPRVEWGREIARAGCASAMIDISDGLSSDLTHICEQSKVGAVVTSDKIPFSVSLQRSAARLKKTSLHYALSGGEDYELLFTVPPEKIRRLESLHIPATEIGMVTKARTLFIIGAGGRKETLKPTGFDHFVR